MRLRNSVVLALLATGVGAGIAMFAWYSHDRAAMLETLCKSGFPNFSRPSAVNERDLGCAILGPRRRVSGVLLTGFEASYLMTDDLGAPPAGGGFTGNTWHTCNQSTGCNADLERQLAKPISGLCGTRLASLTTEGWATVTAGEFGHMGMASREFFEDKVISVGPPPTWMVSELTQQKQEAGLDCP